MSETPRIENHAEFAGEPDGWERLWTPHRMAYIKGDRPSEAAGSGCPFCDGPQRSDEDALIVRRGEYCYAILNLFPYNPGHLLICPYRHIPAYLELDGPELAEFTALTQQGIRALTDALAPMGFNLGMNQGEVAGAGVAAHLHQHIVPRWGGDSNFFPIIAQTKAMPTLLGDTRDRVAQAWAALD